MQCPEKIEHELLLPESRIRPKMYSPALGKDTIAVMDFLRSRGDEFVVASHPRTGMVIFTRQNPISPDCELRLVYVERDHPKFNEDELTFEDWVRDVQEEADNDEAHYWRFLSRLKSRMLPPVGDDDDLDPLLA